MKNHKGIKEFSQNGYICIMYMNELDASDLQETISGFTLSDTAWLEQGV